MSSDHALTNLLELVAGGDDHAANQLFSVVYKELKRLATHQMQSESADHTLQPTALVHEAWLKLIGSHAEISWKNRSHFMASTAQAMRRILVDAARSRKRIKRGGEYKRVVVENDCLAGTVEQRDDNLLALHEALEHFESEHPRQAAMVSLRHFGGFTNAQAADQLNISTATAERDWVFAKAWLRNWMEAE